MLLFPYLERRGRIAVPRVLWGREDQVIVKLRRLRRLINDGMLSERGYDSMVKEVANLAKEVLELVFRENKILYPALWAFPSEGEWLAIKEVFIRTKTLLGRRVEFYHLPRLEKLVRKVIDELKEGIRDYQVFWTRIHGRIIRVMIVAVKDKDNKYLGAVEIVEDFTGIVEKSEEIKKRIITL